jgi:hypothetical protein
MKPARVKDLSNRTFGRLTVERFSCVRREAYWICRCRCGNTKEVRASHLKSGNVQSCGCLPADRITTLNTTHGQSKTREFRIWQQMKYRCENPNYRFFADYGGRGLTVCPSWSRSFEAFFRDMGPAPRGATLERKKNDQGYSKANCCWASRVQQQANRRNTVFVDYEGRSVALSELTRRFNVPHSRVAHRIRSGWDVHVALTKGVYEKHA